MAPAAMSWRRAFWIALRSGHIQGPPLAVANRRPHKSDIVRIRTEVSGIQWYFFLVPRFYLHVHDTRDAIDEEGSDLPHLDAAYFEAIAGLRYIVAEQVRDGRLPTYTHITITDQCGNRLGLVTFNDAIEVSSRAERDG
jgi:hypothetical protein